MPSPARFPLAPMARRAPVAHACFGALLGIGPLIFLGATPAGLAVALLVGTVGAVYMVRTVHAGIIRIHLVVDEDGAVGVESTRPGDRNANLFDPRPAAGARLAIGEQPPAGGFGRLVLALSAMGGFQRPGARVLITDVRAAPVVVRFADDGDELWITPADPDAVVTAVGALAQEAVHA